MLENRVKSLSHVRLFAIPWTVAYNAPPSMGFSRQEYWSGLPFPSPGDLPNQGLNLGLPHCRQMLYHLSHQGSQRTEVTSEKTECLYNARYLSKFGPALNLIYLANDQQENRDLSPTATQN